MCRVCCETLCRGHWRVVATPLTHCCALLCIILEVAMTTATTCDHSSYYYELWLDRMCQPLLQFWHGTCVVLGWCWNGSVA
jgi:hypothetical protein